jgi:signal peptidase I
MNKSKKVILEILSYVVIIGLVILFKTFIASPIRVNGGSMYKTLHDKDIMILNEITRNIYIKLALANGSILEGTNTLADFVDSI